MTTVKLRILRNPYGSGAAACHAWGKFIWGHPLQQGPDKFHVYGHHRRKRRVDVEFTAKRIVVAVHWPTAAT